MRRAVCRSQWEEKLFAVEEISKGKLYSDRDCRSLDSTVTESDSNAPHDVIRKWKMKCHALEKNSQRLEISSQT